MKQIVYPFPSSACTVYHQATLDAISDIAQGRLVIITDTNVQAAHSDRLAAYTCIVIPAGEQHKHQATVDGIIAQLIEMGADRKTHLVGIGGGVVTDITGYVASIYMRGIPFGFVPTTVLTMVDAALGGKNGIDVGLYKNMVGCFRQPSFILYDTALLQSLPDAEWINGFAEIIKHACIKDAALFDWLAGHQWRDFKADAALAADLIERNIAIKAAVVLNDEKEVGERKLLNFGHTLGHAVENLYQLPHGHAVSIGMVAACRLSEEIQGFASADKERVTQLLHQYGLPTQLSFDKEKVMSILLKDKKQVNGTVHFVLLSAIGRAEIVPIGIPQLTDLFEQCL
jgi:3-dehydroquinate synthase